MQRPTNIPSQNNHRVALFLPEQQHNDFDRIEDLAADGLQSARNAHKNLIVLMLPKNRQLSADITELGNAVEKRRLLNDRFVNAATSLIRHLSREDLIAARLDHQKRPPNGHKSLKPSPRSPRCGA